MCGIVGFSGPSGSNYDPANIRILMSLNILRGEDAAGFFRPLSNKKFEDCIFKSVGRADKNLLIDYNNEINNTSNIFIGHLRQASVKHKTFSKNTTHPFYFNGVVGVHNGTVTNISDLKQKYNKIGNFDVDSAHIFDYISKYENLQILNDIAGSATLLFAYENDPNALKLFKKDREIHVGYRPEGMYISSEKYPLEIIGCEKIEELKDLSLYTIENGAIIETTKLTNKPYYHYSYNNNASFSNNNTFVYRDFNTLNNNIIHLIIKAFNSLIPQEKLDYLKDFNCYQTKLTKELIKVTDSTKGNFTIFTLKNNSEIYSQHLTNVNQVLSLINVNLADGKFNLRFKNNELCIDVSINNNVIADKVVKINTFLKLSLTKELIEKLIIDGIKYNKSNVFYTSDRTDLELITDFYTLQEVEKTEMIDRIKDKLKENTKIDLNPVHFSLDDVYIDEENGLFGIALNNFNIVHNGHNNLINEKIKSKNLRNKLTEKQGKHILFNNGQICSFFELVNNDHLINVFSNVTETDAEIDEERKKQLDGLNYYEDKNITKSCISVNNNSFSKNKDKYKELFGKMLPGIVSFVYPQGFKAEVVGFFNKTEFEHIHFLYSYKNKNKEHVINSLYNNSSAIVEYANSSVPKVVNATTKVRVCDLKINNELKSVLEIPTTLYKDLLKGTEYEEFFKFKNQYDLDVNQKEKLYYLTSTKTLYILPLSKLTLLPNTRMLLPDDLQSGKNYIELNIPLRIDKDIEDKIKEDIEETMDKNLNDVLNTLEESEDDFSFVNVNLDSLKNQCSELHNSSIEKLEELALGLTIIKEQLENEQDEETKSQLIQLINGCEENLEEIEGISKSINKKITSFNRTIPF